MEIREFRELGHRIVDRLAAYLEKVEEGPLFPRVEPGFLTELFSEPLPEEPASVEDLLREVEEKLFPYCVQVNHPGYMGLMTPTPAPVGVLADFIASAINQNLGAFVIGPSAVAMERLTVRWLADLVGYDSQSGGNLTSGGTMANFIGLKLARDFISGDRSQHEGAQGRWGVYVSEERHVSVDKAVDAVGVGRHALRALPTDDGFQLRLDALEEAVDEDRKRGVRPLCVIGIAGTTNTGSVDPLKELRRIADREGMWFHVDAAYGGGMLLSNRSPRLLAGLEQADSITIDPHKWFYAPLDAGAILVRDESRLTASFGIKPAYLTDELDPEGERYQYYVHGFEQSRRFRSLKVWMSFKRYGSREIGRWIDANVQHAKRLYTMCQDRKDFTAAVPPLMSAVCLRYDPGGLTENQVGGIHHKVARRIEDQGRFWLSTTFLKKKWWFRVNPINFRTRSEHMDELMDLLEKECRLVHS